MFLDDNFNAPDFLFSYTMIFVFPLLYIGWKLLKRTKIVKPEDADIHRDAEEIDDYHNNFVPSKPRNAVDKWFNKLFS